MNNDENFKVRIVDMYKGLDEPIINNLYKNEKTQGVMVLSVQNELPLLKKNRKNWVLKDKRKLLKEIDMIKNKKVKEFTSSITKLGKNSPDINLMKDTNNKIINELESIDNFKKSLNNDEIYLKLKDLSIKKKFGNKTLSDISRLSDTDEFIEVFSN
jgi:hypothetical protein